MILSCKNISKSFVVESILKDINFIINEGEKVALIGVNGAGKTTLFRIITGELLPDSGDVLIGSGKTIGYLKQNALSESGLTLFNEVYHADEELIGLKKELENLEEKIHLHNGISEQLTKLNDDYHRARELYESRDGYQYDSLVKGVLHGLGFTKDDYEKHVGALSGGQKTRVALAKELIRKPDILMLDEPTNHLDIDAINWLEGYLKSYLGTLLIISHDRFFLDMVTNKTIEIEFGKATAYDGNYTLFIKKKAETLKALQKQYEQQQQNIKHQEEVITKLKSFNREKSIKRAESREKLLDRIERIEKPNELHADMNLQLRPRNESGNDVLTISNLSKSFDHLHLFSELSLDIKKGEHIALLGDNGTGKSTLFKIINDVIPADSGDIRIGARVKIGYYDQEHQLLNPNNNLIEEISDAYPSLDEGQIRNILASYLFKGDDVFKRVSTLSGGEKGRLTLVKLMLSEANFLILDEPTNHLDIISKNILEEALIGYEGTLFVISHDRYFVNRIATRILNLENKQLTSYIGNYDDFLAKRESTPSYTVDSTMVSDTENKVSWQEEKALKAERRKLENRFETLETLIHDIESQVETLQAQLYDEAVYTDHIKATEVTEEKESLENQLLELYDEWESISSALE